jgi:hypothetical protein
LAAGVARWAYEIEVMEHYTETKAVAAKLLNIAGRRIEKRAASSATLHL